MNNIVGLQKDVILRLEERNKVLTMELVEKIETISNLSQVLAYLTDGRFRNFTADNWKKIITDYCESEIN